MRRVVLACFALTLLEFAMVRPVNAAAMAIADSSEGCVLHTYRDSAGILTAGWGHTGPDVLPGMTVSQAQADAWRAADMARSGAFVEARVKVPLSDDQFSVLAEFTYNIGTGAFLGSTLLRLLNQGKYDAVPAQLMRWTRVGGRVMPGLVARRAKEAALFAGGSGDQTTKSIPEGVPPGVPVPPSLVERVLAWFHGNASQPA